MFAHKLKVRMIIRCTSLCKLLSQPTRSSMSLDLPADYQSLFFINDVVAKKGEPSYRGKVLRAWAEEDDQHPMLQLMPMDLTSLNRPLRRGEVGVMNIAKAADLAIIPESELELLCRDFIRGDVVKKSLDQVESGVVTFIESDVKVEHVITRHPVVGGNWVPMKKFASSFALEAGDKVVYDNWLGTIKDIFEEATLISISNWKTYKIAELGGCLAIGKLAEHLYPPGHVPEGVQFTSQPASDVVIDIRPVVVYVNWEVMNQTLPISEQDNHPKPQALWTGPDLHKLTHLDMLLSTPPMIDTTIVFKDESDDAVYGLQPLGHLDGETEIRAMRITACRSKCTVRWQDGHVTEESGTSLVPYTNVDDYDAWPGEHLNWRDDQGILRPSLVLTYDSHQRTSEIMFLDTKEKQLVSVMELETGGQDKPELGVRYGTQVLLCKDNGCQIPEVPSLGEIDDDLTVNVRRAEMLTLAERFAQNPSLYDARLPAGDPKSIDWFGEVSDLGFDGLIGIDVPSGERKRVPINQVIMLNEAQPAQEPQPGFDDGQDDASMSGSEESWETFEGDDGDQAMGSGDEDYRIMPGAMPPLEPAPQVVDIHVPQEQAEISLPLSAGAPNGYSRNNSNDFTADTVMTEAEDEEVDAVIGGAAEKTRSPIANSTLHDDALVDEEHWKPFDILEEAPVDHAYIKEPRLTASSKSFYSRLQREHRALASSLPDNIIVRSYEDRTDLLRCLIVGPQGTPYADSPFVFDVYLDPSRFPFEPPRVYFHSHTFGKGRCNPNLYEEGKVCLSVLGTWQGESSETWIPTKSSLLQVFVSISGLVLVRQPYYCEPAFAKLEGTREGKVNSRLYSEKAYVLSRSFVKTALEKAPTGLEAEIKWLYFTKGRLDRVIAHASALIVKAEAIASQGVAEESEEAAWNADAVGSLSTGAALTTKRTITALRQIRDTTRNIT